MLCVDIHLCTQEPGLIPVYHEPDSLLKKKPVSTFSIKVPINVAYHDFVLHSIGGGSRLNRATVSAHGSVSNRSRLAIVPIVGHLLVKLIRGFGLDASGVVATTTTTAATTTTNVLLVSSILGSGGSRLRLLLFGLRLAHTIGESLRWRWSRRMFSVDKGFNSDGFVINLQTVHGGKGLSSEILLDERNNSHAAGLSIRAIVEDDILDRTDLLSKILLFWVESASGIRRLNDSSENVTRIE